MKAMNVRHVRLAILALAMAGATLALSPAIHAQGQNDSDVASAVKAKLHGKQYSNVQVNSDPSGVVTLSGTVDLYEYKADAVRQAHKVDAVKAIRDEIQVGGTDVSDQEIEKKLGPELAYSREGYGNLFDAILMHVQNGVVTLSGHAHDYPNRDAAVGLAASTPGVKEVIDNIQVDPVSPMDDGIRMQVARSIYSQPALNKYAINPVRPIRITVQNGHVQLWGTVDNKMDRQIADMRAKQVPGVFSVQNNIQVAGQPSEQQQKANPQMNQQGNVQGTQQQHDSKK